MRSRMARASSARRIDSSFEVVMTSRWRSVKAARQRSRQASTSASSSGQARCSRQLAWRRRRGAAPCRGRPSRAPSAWADRLGRPVLREVREADLALVALAVGGDEEQIVRRPAGAFGAVGGRTLLHDDLAQDAAQRDDRKRLRLELDEEDAPGLAWRERPELLDFLDLGGVLGSTPSSSGV